MDLTDCSDECRPLFRDGLTRGDCGCRNVEKNRDLGMGIGSALTNWLRRKRRESMAGTPSVGGIIGEDWGRCVDVMLLISLFHNSATSSELPR